MVTITAHDGDASIDEDVVLSVDDQSECKIYLVSRHLFAKMLTLTVYLSLYHRPRLFISTGRLWRGSRVQGTGAEGGLLHT